MDLQSSLFPVFMWEAMSYVDAWTPTRINHGGCGWFAHSLIPHLESFEIPYEIYFVTFNENSGERLKLFVESEGKITENDLNFHVLLKINNQFFLDSAGFQNPFFYLTVKHHYVVSKNTLEKVLLEDVWNPVFDKDTLPIICDKLNYVFQRYYDFKPGIFNFPKKGQVCYTKHTILKSQLSDFPF